MAPADTLPLIRWSKLKLPGIRNSCSVVDLILNTAIDVMILGYPSQANRLIQTLYNSAHGLQFGSALWPLHLAWEATASSPDFVRTPDPDHNWDGFDDTEGGKKRWEILKNNPPGGFPRELAEKRPNFGPGDVVFALKHPTRVQEFWKTNTPLAVALEVAMLAGDEETARELVKKNLVGLYKHFQEHWDDEVDTLRKWMNDRLRIHTSTRI